jgi:DNA-binding MarR family transcriptional regulator
LDLNIQDVEKVRKRSSVPGMGQKEDVRSILELQDEIVQRRAVWDSAPWLELNMSTPQLKALLLISDEEAIRMRELARKLGGSFSNATVLVDRLVDRGLVERLMDPDDRRVVLVRATGEGQALIEQLVTSWRALSELVLDSMDPEDIAALRRGLAALLDASKREQASKG